MSGPWRAAFFFFFFLVMASLLISCSYPLSVKWLATHWLAILLWHYWCFKTWIFSLASSNSKSGNSYWLYSNIQPYMVNAPERKYLLELTIFIYFFNQGGLTLAFAQWSSLLLNNVLGKSHSVERSHLDSCVSERFP